MKKIFLLSLLFFAAFYSKNAQATHYAGGELYYDWISDSTFRFTAILYRSCAFPNGSGGNSQSATFTPNIDMCWLNTTTGQSGSLQLDSVLNFANLPVSTGCPGAVTQCTDLTSTIPGYEEWHYENTMTLVGPSNLYRFWLSGLCCRNGGITNLAAPGGLGFHIEATLNWNAVRNAPQTNSSPVFTAKPTPYICVNQPYSYNNQGVDINGDSLVYTSVIPQNNGGTCANPANTPAAYAAPPAGSLPFNPSNNPFYCNSTFAVNANSGIMQVTPAATGQVVVTVQCDEYRQGVLIGSMMRDIQINILACAIANPVQNLQFNTINNLAFNGVTGNFDGCVGSPITFCSLITGAVDTSTLAVNTNAGVGTVLPGAVVNMTGYGTDSVLVCITWTPTISDTSLNIVTINYNDTSCIYSAVSAVISFSLPIYIFPQTEAYGDTAVCAGTPVQLSALGGSAFTWTALPGGSGQSSLSCTNCANPIATPTVTTMYQLASNLKTVCADSLDTVLVTVLPIPSINPISDDTLCSNGTYQIDATVNTPGNFSYTWSPNVPYFNSNNVPNPVITNPTSGIGVQSTQTFTVTIAPVGFTSCSASDTVTFTYLQGMNIVNPDTTICFGDDVTVITSGSNIYNYSWTPTTFLSDPSIKDPTILGMTASTNYYLTASFPNCPDIQDSLKITIEPIPVANAGPDRLICAGDTLRMAGSVTPLNADPKFYTTTWSPAFDLVDANDLTTTMNGVQTTTFTLTATTSKGCQDTDQVVVVVVPTDFLTLGNGKEICPNNSTTLTAGGAVNYIWSPATSLNTNTGNTVIASPAATEIYSIAATDINGCKDSGTIRVFVAPLASLNAGEDVVLYPGDVAYLNAQGNCYTYSWTPSFGLSATNLQDPIATPSTTTQYVVKGSTEYGCTTLDSILVTRLTEGNISSPNAFTPGNGNGSNDVFKVDKNGIAKLNYLRVFNRWGELIFETSNIEQGWDGTYKGKPQPMGTYMYMVDAQTIEGKRYTKNGNVTLIR